MNKFNKVSFEEMLKYEGLIACEHELLIEELYKIPMNFSTFLTKLISFYSDFEIKEIFLNCTWYNVIREKARVINLNDYINGGYNNDRYDEFITKDKLGMIDDISSKIYNNLLHGIYESTFGNNIPGIIETCKISDKNIDDSIKDEINDIFDKIDESVKEYVDKYITSFEDIGNIMELELPECSIDKNTLEEQIEKYIKLNGNIYILYNNKISKLGDILSYSNNKIKVKIVDKMLSIFNDSNKKVELVIPNYLLEEGADIILESMYIDADNINLGLSNNLQHDLNSVLCRNLEELIDIKCNEYIGNIVELELPECGLDKDTLGKQIKKYIESHNGDIYIIYKNESKKLGNILSYNDNKIKVKLINDMVPLFESSNKKVDLIMPVDLINGGIDLKYVFINADKPLSLPYKEELNNFLDSLKQMYFKE